ncbi:Transposon Tn7 transposition protein TnsC [Burkholderia lata]|nr:Transposon Tn7 transposition protein TnsC [Burkholderia lata]
MRRSVKSVRKSTVTTVEKSDVDAYKEVPLNVGSDPIFSRICPSVSACYHDHNLELPENWASPLILALPPFEGREQLAAAMTVGFAVPHSEDARKLHLQLRLLAIERISRVLVLTEAHFKLIDWIHISLRHRYRGLVPARSLRKLTQENYEATQQGRTQMIYAPETSHADCIFIAGLSGAGKTTTVKMVLSMFPMIIEHTNFREIEARFTQVVWIFVSCPPNGSVLTLMKGILHWFDTHLGTYYVEEVKSRANTGDYIKVVISKLKSHHVGMLIIDEIQFAIKSAEKTDLLGFVTSLLNDGECLFVLVGTPDAGKVIKETVRNLRRIVSRTYISLELFPTTENVMPLAREITAIDFMPEAPANPKEIAATLIEVGAGSPAFMKLAWEHVQYAGLRGQIERITPALISEAVVEAFSLVEGLLGALRKRDLLALDMYRDTAIAQLAELRERMLLEKKRRRLNLNDNSNEASQKFSKCVGVLVSMNWSEINAEAFSRDILMKDPAASVEDVLRFALRHDDAAREKELKPHGVPRKVAPRRSRRS